MFASDLANIFASDMADMFTNDLADMFTNFSAKIFTNVSANMFTSNLTNMFTSVLANIFTSDLANMFTSDLTKLSSEFVGLVPRIQDLILAIFQFCHLKNSSNIMKNIFNSISIYFWKKKSSLTNIRNKRVTRLFYKQHLYKQSEIENGKKISKS